MSHLGCHFIDANSLIHRVRSLSIVLTDVKVALTAQDKATELGKQLPDFCSGCYNVLSDLEKMLDNYQEVDSDPKSCDHKDLTFAIRRGWKRLRWERNEVKELRSRLVSNISLLNTFYALLLKYYPVFYVMNLPN